MVKLKVLSYPTASLTTVAGIEAAAHDYHFMPQQYSSLAGSTF